MTYGGTVRYWAVLVTRLQKQSSSECEVSESLICYTNYQRTCPTFQTLTLQVFKHIVGPTSTFSFRVRILPLTPHFLFNGNILITLIVNIARPCFHPHVRGIQRIVGSPIVRTLS